MLSRLLLPACALLFVLASPLSSAPAVGAALRWDATGHRTVAAIAYGRLEPATRARVDSLLRRHPDYEALSRGITPGDPELGIEVFMRASVWPDMLRGDARFHNENRPAEPQTPLLPGFPDMQRHAQWHYIDRTFSTDGTPSVEPRTQNAVTQIIAFTAALGDPAVPIATRAYNFSWILHLVGDLHQPLHATSRATRARPTGDAGGNGVQVLAGAAPADSMNLHSYWDGLIGRPNRGASAVEVARDITAEIRPVESVATRVDYGPYFEATVHRWALESETLARYVVYTVGPDRAQGAAPVRVTPAYQSLAEQVARQRIAIAGYRLANLIEARLR